MFICSRGRLLSLPFLFTHKLKQMKTLLGNDILPTTLGIVYLCDYNYIAKTLKVTQELQFKNQAAALNAYAEIPNPESQVAYGSDKEDFEIEIEELHNRMNDEEWVEKLSEYL